MEEYNTQEQQPHPDPASVGVVAYLKFLAVHSEHVSTLEQRLAEYAVLCPLLFEFYQEDSVTGRVVLHEVAKLLGVSVGEMLSEFERMSEPEEDEAPHTNGAAPPGQAGIPYEETSAGIIWRRPTKDGEIAVRLTNFTARIVSNVTEDDGVEVRRAYEVEARMDGRAATVKVSDKEFPAMAWPAEAFGSHAILAPGLGAKEHARYAIQLFSHDETKEKRVYTHTGWRKINGEWVYLHAGGAIGASGSVADIEVSPPEALSRYVLPDPPEGEAVHAAVHASLHVLQVAPRRMTFLGYLALWRAVLSDADLSVFLTGKTNSGKSSYAALIQQHYGPEMDIKSLPASWIWTDNALELTAFHAKDAIITVDEFVPQGSVNEMQQYYRKADRLLRSQANRQARGRLTSTLSQRPLKPPRGIIVSTGEDVPRGHSLRARVLIGEMTRETTNWDMLTLCQRDAAAGIYAHAFAAYVQWVAGRFDALKKQVKQDAEALRSELTAKHDQTRDLATRLLAGWKVFLTFAGACEAITAEEQDGLWHQAKAALQESLNAQDRLQTESDPARRFLELLGAALAGGRAHLDGSDGGVPPEATAWGWEREVSGTWQDATAKYHAKGELIGWVEDEDIYLEPDTSLAVAQRLAKDQGESLPVGGQTLRRRLKEDGLLASWDVKRETVTVRRTINGKQYSVLHLKAEALYPRKKPDIPDTAPPKHTEDPDQAAKKPDISSANPTNPTSDPTSENAAKSNGYTPNVGFVGCSIGGEGQRAEKKENAPAGQKNDVGFVGCPQNQNPTSEPTAPEEGEL